MHTTETPPRCFRSIVAFGGNVAWNGQPVAQTLIKARDELSALPGHKLRGWSGLWHSDPVQAEGPSFLNAVAWIDTPLEPPAWLELLLSIEARYGRRRPLSLVGGISPARSLDLDLIWFEGQSTELPGLVLPHPRATQRGFVLVPLAELVARTTGLEDLRLPCPLLGEPSTPAHLLSMLAAEARSGLRAITTEIQFEAHG